MTRPCGVNFSRSSIAINKEGIAQFAQMDVNRHCGLTTWVNTQRLFTHSLNPLMDAFERRYLNAHWFEWIDDASEQIEQRRCNAEPNISVTSGGRSNTKRAR